MNLQNPYREIIITILFILILFVAAHKVSAEENMYGEPFPIEITAYCDSGTTASGIQTRPGICAAKREWIGKTAILYDAEMQIIGIYEILDTGGDARIKNGTVVDLYMQDEQDCLNFGRQQGFIQIVDAKG